MSNISRLECELRPSKIFATLVATTYTAALGALWYCNVWLEIKLLLSLVILVDGSRQLYCKALLKHRDSVVKVWYHQQQWQLCLYSGAHHSVSLQQLLPINSQVIFIKFYNANCNTWQRLFIFRDSIAADQLHQLLLIARISKLMVV